MTTNGANGQRANGPIVRRIVCDSGVEVDVAPLSPHAIAKIRTRAHEEHPMPDEEQFRKPVPNAATEGDTYIDKHDPEYKRLVNEATQGQAEYLMRAIRDIALSYPRGKEQLIEDFRPALAKQREYIDLPEDEWEATFWFGIIASPADNETITLAALSVLPITMQEVIEGEHGLRVFRYYVQGRRPSQLAAGWEKIASRLEQGSKSKS